MDVIDKFKDTRILVIGDVMLDRYVHGTVERISPEAPVPVFVEATEEDRLGAAANVALNLYSFGAEAYLVSVIADDDIGMDLRRLCLKQLQLFSGMLFDEIPQKNQATQLTLGPRRFTTLKKRFVDGQQVFRTDRESRHDITDASAKAMLDCIDTRLPNTDVVIISDYAKGVCTQHVLRTVINAAKEAGKPVIVDPKAKDFSVYKGATIITPNQHEYDTSKHAGFDGHILLTQGKHGMTLIPKEGHGEVISIPATAKEVYDVTGAGDTVVAVLALGMACGLTLHDAAKLSNLAAGIVVGKRGSATVTPEELKAAV